MFKPQRFVVSLFLAVFYSLASSAQAHVAIDAQYMAELGLREGDIVGSNNSSDPDIFIISEYGYKRLFLSPAIFGFYGHLRFADTKRFIDTTLDSMPISGLFRNCEIGDERVYGLEVTSEDSAVLRWINITGQQATLEDPDFFKKVFCINAREFAYYTKGAAYSSLSQVPRYERSNLPTAGGNTTSIPLNVPEGLSISLFTPKIGPLRFMAFSPDGILFVSMPSTAGLYGGSGVASGKIFALPDSDKNGSADEVRTVLSGLRLPHGLAFHDGYLYIAEEGAVARYPYSNGGTLGSREVIAQLPTGGSHNSRTIVFGASGKMYVSVGSACNNCTTGDSGTAVVWEFNADGTGGRIFASGLRNSVGLALNPATNELWATENSRDLLSDDLPPDEINILRDSQNYGWPYCYGRSVKDSAYPQYNCADTEASVHDLQAHSAPLGLAFVSGAQFSRWVGDLIVARHGSWNRSQPVGYDVVRLDVEGNKIVGEYLLLTGWLNSSNQKLGRPVDVIFGPDGALYISDDMANLIYRVTAQ